MNKKLWLVPLALLAGACTVKQLDEPTGNDRYPSEVTARIEDSSSTSDTKVYLDDELKVLWTNDDRITLFNKYTYNKQYRFDGETGANSGVFKEVPSGDVIVGNNLDNVFAVYPYKESTAINNSGIISFDLPAEQVYSEDSFGLGANTMVSATTNTELLFKNLCGYLVLKLYGEGVSVSSITLTGNNGEVLAGKADVTATVGSTPTLSFRETGTSTSITLNCETPVTLGATATDATVFWLVVPPTVFTGGFTITVTDPEGKTFETVSNTSKEIERNKPYRMKALEVEMGTSSPQPNNIIYYTSSDGQVITPNAVFGANILSNDYNEQGVITFDGDVTSIGARAFLGRNSLTSISIPESTSSIGDNAFVGCSLTSFYIPSNVTSIGSGVFDLCTSLQSFSGKYVSSDGRCIIVENKLVAFARAGLSSYSIPEGVTCIGRSSFRECSNLRSLSIPESVTTIENAAFLGCSDLTSIVIPENVTTIENSAFSGCSRLKSITIPESVTSIGRKAFYICSSLTSIIVNATTPPTGESTMFDDTNNCPIYVPAEFIEEYKAAAGWSDYADRIKGIIDVNDYEISVAVSSVTSSKLILALVGSSPSHGGYYYENGIDPDHCIWASNASDCYLVDCATYSEYSGSKLYYGYVVKETAFEDYVQNAAAQFDGTITQTYQTINYKASAWSLYNVFSTVEDIITTYNVIATPKGNAGVVGENGVVGTFSVMTRVASTGFEETAHPDYSSNYVAGQGSGEVSGPNQGGGLVEVE